MGHRVSVDFSPWIPPSMKFIITQLMKILIKSPAVVPPLITHITVSGVVFSWLWSFPGIGSDLLTVLYFLCFRFCFFLNQSFISFCWIFYLLGMSQSFGPLSHSLFSSMVFDVFFPPIIHIFLKFMKFHAKEKVETCIF